MTAPERATALLAAGRLSTAQQVRCVELGWLSASQCSAAAQTAIANSATLRARAATAMTTNRTYLALSSPTTAQVAAQVKALTNQSQGIMRLLLKQLDATN